MLKETAGNELTCLKNLERKQLAFVLACPLQVIRPSPLLQCQHPENSSVTGLPDSNTESLLNHPLIMRSHWQLLFFTWNHGRLTPSQDICCAWCIRHRHRMKVAKRCRSTHHSSIHAAGYSACKRIEKMPLHIIAVTLIACDVIRARTWFEIKHVSIFPPRKNVH